MTANRHNYCDGNAFSEPSIEIVLERLGGFYVTKDDHFSLNEVRMMNHITCCLGELLKSLKLRDKLCCDKTKMFFEFLALSLEPSGNGGYKGLDLRQIRDPDRLPKEDLVLWFYWEIFTKASDLNAVADHFHQLVTYWRRRGRGPYRDGPAGPSLMHAAAELPLAAAMSTLPLLHRLCPNLTRLRDSNGRLPIHYASRLALVPDVIKLLVDFDPATLKEKSYEYSETPMYLIVERIHTVDGEALLQHLLQHEAAREALLMLDHYSLTPLQRALQSASCTLAIVKMLAEACPASVSLVCGNSTVLHQICLTTWDNPIDADDATRYLFHMYPAAASIRDKFYGYPLQLAVQRRSIEILQLLLDACPSSITDNSSYITGTALYQAAQSGDLNKIKYIYNIFPDAIKISSSGGKIELPLHAIFDSGSSDCNAKTSVAVARAQIDDEAVSFLFMAYPEASAIADKEGKFPLHGAARYSSLELVRRIYEAHPTAIRSCISYVSDSYPMRPSLWMGSPLHVAAALGDAGKIDFLYRLYPDAISLKVEELRGLLPFHAALYSLPSSITDIRQKRHGFCAIYELHPPAIKAKVGSSDNKTALQLIVHRLQEGLRGMKSDQLRDYEEDNLIWKLHFILKHWPESAFQPWARDAREDESWQRSYDRFNRKGTESIYTYCERELREVRPIVPRLMLVFNPKKDPDTLRGMNYSDRRGAMYLFYSVDLTEVLNQGRYYQSGGDDCDDDGNCNIRFPRRIVGMLRSHGNKDLYRKIVMML
jgi:ankyrin repeat protein